MSESVFVVVEVVAIHDQAGYAEYAQGARAQMLERGGKVVARGGRHFEGTPEVGGMMIQQWPSEADFVAWQDSVAYRPLKEIRAKSVSIRIAIVRAL